MGRPGRKGRAGRGCAGWDRGRVGISRDIFGIFVKIR